MTTFEPTIRTQKDLEDAWRTLMQPLGFAGHSIWLMFIEASGTPLPHLSQIEEAVKPPSPTEQESFVQFLGALRDEMRTGDRLVFLRSRPGRAVVDAVDRAWAQSLYAACRDARITTDVVHLAGDDDVVPIPLDDLARSA
jgi:hypothetical protein